MSDPLPDIVVHHSSAWAQASPEDDVAAWAPDAADRLWSAAGQRYSPLDVGTLGAQLEVLRRSAFTVPCAGAFVFCPEPSRGPRAVLRVSDLRFPPGTGHERIVDDLLLPADHQLLTPQVTVATGPGSRRLRIRQRAWTEGSRAVSDFIAYVLPVAGGAWALSTCVPDPREADRWLAEFDELAAGVRLQEAS